MSGIDPSKQPWGPDTSWGSYMPPLMACLAATGSGAVLEIGMGHWSTPVLHAYCEGANRRLVSCEHDPDWAEPFVEKYKTNLHTLYATYDVFPELAKEYWSVVLIDNSPGERRGADAELFVGRAEVVIVHDWSSEEISKPFLERKLLDKWRYALYYTAYSPHTLILTNREDIREGALWP